MTDAHIRKQAVDPSLSFIVSAPAGSGKTSLLVLRYINLLCEVKRPENVIAITFTRKAAAEMLARVQEVIQLATNQDTLTGYMLENKTSAQRLLKHAQQHNWNLSAQSMRILTIDALNNALTQNAPLTSGLGAEPELCQNSIFDYKQAIQNFFYSVKSHDSEIAFSTLLHNINNNYQHLESLLMHMLQTREQWLRYIFITQPEKMRAILESTLQEHCDNVINIFQNSFCKQLRDEITPLLRFASMHYNKPLLDEGLNLPEPTRDNLFIYKNIFHLLFTQSGTWRKAVTKNQGFPTKSEHFTDAECKKNKNLIQGFIKQHAENALLLSTFNEINTLPNACYSDEQWTALDSLITLLPEVVAHLKVVFQQKNRIDYTETSLSAVYALEQNHMGLGAQVDAEIQHILIDEFQDTSLAQHQLIQSLTKHWDPSDNKTLFCVGDPMQSIYRFRQANVNLFINATQQGIGHIQLEHLTLTQNFRSDPKLIDWVNKHMQHAFAQDGSVISFNKATSSKQQSTMAEVSINTYRTDCAEAEGVLETIQSIRKIDTTGTIAVIVRARSHLSKIIPALQDNGIAINAQELTPIAKQKNISYLYNLTCIFINLDDEIAWTALLRSPIIGCALEDLYKIKQQQRLAELINTIPDSINNDTFQRVQAAVSIINAGLQQTTIAPLVDVLRHTWNLLSGNLSTQMENSTTQDYFIHLQSWLQVSTTRDATEFSTLIQQTYSNNLSLDNNAIELMTIHHAKGLEFDHVIIPGLSRYNNANKKQLLLWRETISQNHQPKLLLAPLSLTIDDEQNKIYKKLRQLDANDDLAEISRVLYVAVTRARTSLHLFATMQEKEGQWQKPRSNSLLAKIWDLLVFIPPQPLTAEENIDDASLNTNFQLTRWNNQLSIQEPVKHSAIQNKATSASIIGTITHQVLQSFKLSDAAQWLQSDTELHKYLSTLCRNHGFSHSLIKSTCSQIITCVTSIINDPVGQWIFCDSHSNIGSELKICRTTNAVPETYIIDRTFIDNGTRWIIDFKTAQAEDGTEPSEFINNQRKLYGQQLANYATLFVDEGLPIMVALYFPGNTNAQQRWVAWQEYNPGDKSWPKQTESAAHSVIS